MRIKSQKIKIGVAGRYSYDIHIGHGLLANAGTWARRSLGNKASRVVIVSNQTVFDIYGGRVRESLVNSGFDVSVFLIGDGEEYKTLKTVDEALTFFAETHLSRTDAVIALGGGVVGDLAGFAAAIYLRGINVLQIPTTLLSMIDSSVGGKTGVNSQFGKNLIGAFHQPGGVLIDIATLDTLPLRELTAGFCEAIKHGAISSRKLLIRTSDLLATFPPADLKQFSEDRKFQTQLTELINDNIAFKAKIVSGDERESSDRKDKQSRKILNFGHTLAHALEKVTDYKYLTHGEAVGYGIQYAAELSKTLAFCSEKDVKLLNDVVHRAGILSALANIDEKEIFEAFRFDKKHLSGSLQMVLLNGIGKPVIVSEKDIPRPTAQKVLKKLLQKWA